jgi:hypothetical protein
VDVFVGRAAGSEMNMPNEGPRLESPLTRDQEVAIVGAAFPDSPTAVAATQDLSRLGLGTDDIRTAVWTDGRFVLTEGAGGHIWRSIGRWAIMGMVLGTVLTTALAFFLWPGTSLPLLLIIGGSFGGTVGVILGGYFGLNQKRGELWYERDWRDSTDVEGTTLVVFRPRDRHDEAAEVVARHGGHMLSRPGAD